MSDDLFFVLHCIATDQIGRLAGYDDVLEQALVDDLIWGRGSQARFKFDGKSDYDKEAARRKLLGMALDRDPRAICPPPP